MSESTATGFDNLPHWSVTGIEGPSSFFEAVERVLPQATNLFLEGSSIAGEVVELLMRHVELGPYLPSRGTILPRARLFRLRISLTLLQGLATLAKRHPVPELCDHLHLYDSNHALALWYDAFVDPLLLAGTIAEAQVRDLCNRTHASFAYKAN